MNAARRGQGSSVLRLAVEAVGSGAAGAVRARAELAGLEFTELPEFLARLRRLLGRAAFRATEERDGKQREDGDSRHRREGCADRGPRQAPTWVMLDARTPLCDLIRMALPNLLPCPGCARHVRRSEVRCPFCDAELPGTFLSPQLRWFPAERLAPALLAFASVGTGLGACHNGDSGTAPSATASADARPAPSVAPLPSLGAESPRPRELDAIRPRPGAVYGAPPPPGVGPLRGDASIGAVKAEGGTVTNASRVVVGMRAGFRACYVRGLSEEPDMLGTLRVTLDVGPGGDVVSALAKPTGKPPTAPGRPISRQVVSCVETRASSAQFDAPEGRGKARLTFDVTFKPVPPQKP